MGQANDFDLNTGAADLVKYDAANDVARVFSCNTVANKIVMGYGGIDHPLVNTRTATGSGWMYISNGGGVDSCFKWASTLVGETHEVGVDNAYPCSPSAGDRENMVTVMKRNFAPLESYTTGWFWYQFNSADLE